MPSLFSPGLLAQLLDAPGPAPALARAALAGDDLAEVALLDLLEEHGMLESPFKVGDRPLICTATLYYVGEVAQVGFGWLRLREASWVHWTGRLSLLLKHRDFTHASLASRPPRVEPCGEVVVWTQAIVAHYPGPFNLVAEPVQ